MKPNPAFSPHDWNFDTVPDDELVACCYWEYARESAFIRDLKNRCADQKWRKMTNSQNWQYVGRDLETIQSIGPAADVFLSGFFLAPGIVCQSDDQKAPHFRRPDAPRISGHFPLPWQTLSEAERCYRAACLSPDREDPRSQPFSRGYPFMAEWITKHCEARRCAVWERKQKVQEAHPDANAMDLCQQMKLGVPEIVPSIFSAGAEFGVFTIRWDSFTNEEIIQSFRQWVKANRPKELTPPNGKGHNKARDRRANLTRLAVMRLLARFTPLQIVDPRQDRFPAAMATKQFSGPKWQDVTKWHDARREAVQLFHQLFPFLPQDDNPLSWKRPTPGK